MSSQYDWKGNFDGTELVDCKNVCEFLNHLEKHPSGAMPSTNLDYIGWMVTWKCIVNGQVAVGASFKCQPTYESERNLMPLLSTTPSYTKVIGINWILVKDPQKGHASLCIQELANEATKRGLMIFYWPSTLAGKCMATSLAKKGVWKESVDCPGQFMS